MSPELGVSPPFRLIPGLKLTLPPGRRLALPSREVSARPSNAISGPRGSTPDFTTARDNLSPARGDAPQVQYISGHWMDINNLEDLQRAGEFTQGHQS